MKERPILFSGPMVRAILEGRKTQTRRVVKPQPVPYGEASPYALAAQREHIGKPWMPVGGVFQDQWKCPFGQPGDRLWVRETWRVRGGREYEYQRHQPSVVYRCDAEPVESLCNEWRPSIHMPRWASRLTLEITAVRVERLQDISEEDAKAEGVDPFPFNPEGDCWSDGTCKTGFVYAWSSIYGHDSWDANPWVWVVEFRKVEVKR